MHNPFRITLFLLLIASVTINCARTRAVSSTFTPTPITIDGSITDWPRDRMQIENNPEYDMYFANDEDFLYLYVIVKSTQIHSDIEEFGLNLYFDTDNRFRRSFGVIYPIGILNGISNIPGARQEYLQNPGWANISENQQIIASLKNEMPNRVMLVQRSSSRDAIRPIPVNMEALRAQDLHLKMDEESRLLNIEMKVPIRSTRARQFAIDVEDGKPIYVGFEVQPPSLDEILGEDQNINSRDSQTAGTRRQQNASQFARMQLRGEFSRWVKVELAKP